MLAVHAGVRVQDLALDVLRRTKHLVPGIRRRYFRVRALWCGGRCETVVAKTSKSLTKLRLPELVSRSTLVEWIHSYVIKET